MSDQAVPTPPNPLVAISNAVRLLAIYREANYMGDSTKTNLIDNTDRCIADLEAALPSVASALTLRQEVTALKSEILQLRAREHAARAEWSIARAKLDEALEYLDGRCTGGHHCCAQIHIEGCFKSGAVVEENPL